MFEKPNNKKLWIVLFVLIALVAIILVLQTQMYVMLQDLRTFSIGDWYKDTNPFPPAINPIDWYKDTNPFPPAIVK